MKKVFLSMAALALVLASCSKEEVPGTNPDEVTNAVAIRIEIGRASCRERV